MLLLSFQSSLPWHAGCRLNVSTNPRRAGIAPIELMTGETRVCWREASVCMCKWVPRANKHRRVINESCQGLQSGSTSSQVEKHQVMSVECGVSYLSSSCVCVCTPGFVTRNTRTLPCPGSTSEISPASSLMLIGQKEKVLVSFLEQHVWH